MGVSNSLPGSQPQPIYPQRNQKGDGKRTEDEQRRHCGIIMNFGSGVEYLADQYPEKTETENWWQHRSTRRQSHHLGFDESALF